DLIRSLNMITKDVVKFSLWWSSDDLDCMDKSKNHKKTVKNEQARTRELEEYKAEAKDPKP
ncbi:hypothetical protein Tco_1486116, partial [Tanacetum coccineum]